MEPTIQKWFRILATICVIGPLVFIVFGPSFAQDDTDRASRIREQIDGTSRRIIDESDLTRLQSDLNKAVDTIIKRIDKLEKETIDLKTRMRVMEVRTGASGSFLNSTNSGTVAEIPVRPPDAPSIKASGNLANVTMCAKGCDTSKLDEAVKRVAENGIITIEPGTYFDCVRIDKSLTLAGKAASNGSWPHFKKMACNGKAAFVLEAPDITVTGLNISEITVPDQNGACFRVAPPTKTLLIRDITCSKSENGLLGSTVLGGAVTIENSTFEGHGKADRAHGLYFNGGSDVILRNVKILNSNDGHLLKTGAQNMLIENSVIAAFGGNGGVAINAYGGGRLTVRNSVIQLGPNTQNHNFISYADESNRIIAGSDHAILLENNWFIYDDPDRCCRWLFGKNSVILDKITVQNNKFVGNTDPIFSLVNMKLNKIYEDREEAGLAKYDGMISSLPDPGSRRGP